MVTETKIPKGYKKTEVGVIPDDWSVKPLIDVAPLQRGFDLPTSQVKKGNHPVVYSNGILNFHCEYKAKAPGVVTGRSGTIGKVTYVDQDYWPHNTSLWVTDFKGNNPLFIYYPYKHINLERLATGSGVPTLNRNDVHSFRIPLPPFPEQQAIAEALSDVDALIASLEKLITKKRNIKQGAMQQLLTGKKRLPGFSGEWEVKTFEECFSFLPTGSNSRSELSEYGDIKYIHYGDIHTKWSLILDCEKEILPLIAEEKVKNLPLLEDGDLVIADASEDFEGTGKSIEIKNVKGEKIVAGLHTLLLRGDKTKVADGFKAYITSIKAVKNSLVKIATGISVFGISKNNLKSIEIPLPPAIEEQQAIAHILSDMDAEIAALERKREKYTALKQGMMQELLTGRTRLNHGLNGLKDDTDH